MTTKEKTKKEPGVWVTCRVPAEVKARLEELGEESERKMSGEIRYALKRYISEVDGDR